MNLSELNSLLKEVKYGGTLEERNKKAADCLSPRYNLLNAKWELAEKKLKAMQAPRHVWIVYHSEPGDPGKPDEYQVNDCLGLVRYRGEWRLCHASYIDSDGTPTDWKPIIECSGEERVAAAGFVLKLREEVVCSAEKFVARVDRAIELLTEALNEF